MAGERVELWLGRTDGAPVVAAAVRLPLHDNTPAASIDVRTAPPHRRQGHGRAMLRHALDRARAHGRQRVFGQVAAPLDEAAAAGTAAGPAFARAAGARQVLTQVRSVLELAGLAPARLGQLREGAAARATGYTVLQWVDRAPSDAYDDVAALIGRMSTDAPLEAMEWEPEAWTAQRYRDFEDSTLASGRRRVVSAARHDRNGRLVGYTEIGVNVRRPEVGYQWDTIVAPQHRGHRLGMLLKVANLELLRETAPACRLVNTWNAAINAHMIAINDALGFRPVEQWQEW